MHTTNGGSAYGASGKYGNSAAVGQTANGDKYAAANGNTYKNTGSGWSGNSNNTEVQQFQTSAEKSRRPAGEGRKRVADHRHSVEAAEAVGQSRSASARGSASRSGGRR